MARRVAYGCSKLLHLYLTHTGDSDFRFVVDAKYPNKRFCGLEVISPEEFRLRRDEDMEVFVFAVSNGALNSILSFLATLRFRLGHNVFLYSDLFTPSFQETLRTTLGWKADCRLLHFAAAYTLNSRKPIHTTICGTWLFLEAVQRSAALAGDIVEIGAFEGGNVLCALQSPVWPENKTYYVFDSFEGFPELSACDPNEFGCGDYRPENSLEQILAPFSVYPQARIIKGFVPGTFRELPIDGRYTVVFYDCDLYQPAKDTFEYFWDRLVPNGMMLVHDYFTEPGGFAGVKSATDAFFESKECRQGKFWQNTMAVFVKP